jgi:YHS domain-containing protein
MCLREDTAPARLPFGGQTFYFCSFDCARTFAEYPEHYMAGR